MTREEAFDLIRRKYPSLRNGVFLTENEMIDLVLMGQQPSLPEGLWSKDDDNCLHDIKHYISEINDIATSEEVKTRVGTLLLWLDLLRIRIVARNGATKLPEGLEVTDFCKPIPKEIADKIPEVADECIWGKKDPQGLEEAAMASMPKPNGIESNTEFSFFQMVGMFEQGAKWMAGQGEARECTIGMGTNEIICTITEKKLDELGICPGDKVIVQIRKK